MENAASAAFAETAAPIGPSLSVLKLRVTPRGKHLNAGDLAKPSHTDVIHVISDKKRKALENAGEGGAGGGSDEDSDGDSSGGKAAEDAPRPGTCVF